ncbi:NIF3-related protein [Neobacillus massiliamazoniensis]|uniref:NIF3-related protein n=1 Tax=Neobacillus massiliamazoniensis TaxID=1499688 RepID=A0A0U1NSC6_9BACI|nr:NIF3-related protein [Neobacillus massiliamazoniensis]
MTKLQEIVSKLNEEFDIKTLGKDPSFSRFIPSVFDPLLYD